MFRSTNTLILASLLASTLALDAVPGQEPTHTLPRAAHRAWGGSTFFLTPAQTRFRSQRIFHGDHLQPGTVITAFTPRAHPSRSSAGYTADLVVRLENTSLAPGGLGQVLDNNFRGNQQTVIARRAITVPPRPAISDPNDDQGVWFVLDTPFVFTGPHLLVDIDEANRAGPGDVYWDGISMLDESFHTSADGTRCGGEVSGSWAAGSYSLNLSQMPANTPATVLVGFENQNWNGGLLPFDLGPIGWTGCALGVDPVVSTTLATDGSGQASLRIPLPLGTQSFMFSVQGVHPDTRGGFATTNTVHNVIGRSGSWSVVISDDGINARVGFPPGYNIGNTLLLR